MSPRPLFSRGTGHLASLFSPPRSVLACEGRAWPASEGSRFRVKEQIQCCGLQEILVVDIGKFGLIVDDLTEAGEFSIDLYTMPELLTNKLWEHLVSATALWA